MLKTSLYLRIKRKVFFAIFLISVLLTLNLSVVFFIVNNNMHNMANTLGQSINDNAKNVLTEQIVESINHITLNYTDIVNEEFNVVRNYIERKANAATNTLKTNKNVNQVLNMLSNTIFDNVPSINASKKHFVDTSYFATEQGDFIIPKSYEGVKPIAGVDPRSRIWYVKAKKQNSLIWSEIYEDTEGKGKVVTCAKPFYSADGKIVGVAGAGVFLSNVERIFSTISFGEKGFGFLIDNDGKIILNSNNANTEYFSTNYQEIISDKNFTIQQIINKMINDDKETGIYFLGGYEQYINIKKLSAIPWRLVVIANISDIFKTTLSLDESVIQVKQKTLSTVSKRIFFTFFITFIILLITSTVTGILIEHDIKVITSPVKKMVEEMEYIGSGDFQRSLFIKTGDEFEYLSDSINLMLESLKNLMKEKEITSVEQESLKHVNLILNSLKTMVYVTNPQTNEIIFINEEMKKHYNLSDCNGKKCFEVLQKGLNNRCSFCPVFELEKDPSKVIEWIEHSSLTNRKYKNMDRLIKSPTGQIVHVQHSIDMTEILEAKDFAEQSSRYKSSFLATMSHEIRTPMNAILGIAEIQLQIGNISPIVEDAFTKIYESGDLLLNIINDILDLSKIEVGKLELNLTSYAVPSLINDTVQLNRLRFDSQPIDFIVNLDPNTPHDLFGDELRIKQILNNIISNSFKYTISGYVKLNVSTEPKENGYVTLLLQVSDTGAGMSKDQVEKLFDEYTRFNTEANRTTVGAGLGMSITKKLIDIMNGEIRVESQPARGTAIEVRITQKVMNQNECGVEVAERLYNFNYHSEKVKVRSQFTRHLMPGAKILVVDDIESNIYVTKGLLLPYGVEIDTAGSGYEALACIVEGNIYDIIFMDHMMPNMDGMETTKIIRERGYTNTIIALTANALVGQSEVFLKNGFDGYLSKPIDSRELNLIMIEFIRDKNKVKQPEKTEPQKESFFDDNIMGELFNKDAKRIILELENFYKKIDSITDKDLNLYIILVHGIKSSLLTINEKELSDFALSLELAGQEKNITKLKKETPEFIEGLKKVVT